MNRSIIDEQRSAQAQLSNEEIARYSRHLIMPEVTIEGQRRLKAARVLCIGAGGLGSPAAIYLAAGGVGTIGLVDFDDVDLTNLQRQILHGTKDWLIPIKQSEDLQKLNPHKITLIRIEGGGHNNLPSFPQYHNFIRDILAP